MLVGIVWLAVVVTWGVRSIAGALLAGLTYAVFPQLASEYLSGAGSSSRPSCSGSVRSRWRVSPAAWSPTCNGRRDRAGRPTGRAAAEPGARASRRRSGGAAREAAHERAPRGQATVTVRFGGVVALDDVSLRGPRARRSSGSSAPTAPGKTTFRGAVRPRAPASRAACSRRRRHDRARPRSGGPGSGWPARSSGSSCSPS